MRCGRRGAFFHNAVKQIQDRDYRRIQEERCKPRQVRLRALCASPDMRRTVMIHAQNASISVMSYAWITSVPNRLIHRTL